MASESLTIASAHERMIGQMKLCECGCGNPAPIATRTDGRKGANKGEPRRFIQGHSGNAGNRLGGNARNWDGAWTVDPNTGCWTWQRYIHRTGYGSVRGASAHRAVYESKVGPIPKGMQLDHLCRNRACVNPDHLEVVTNAENSRRGTNAKLTMDDAREIRRLRSSGVTLREIGAQFGVTQTTVSLAARGVTWTEAV